jgi:hypothetical protein
VPLRVLESCDQNSTEEGSLEGGVVASSLAKNTRSALFKECSVADESACIGRKCR